MAYVKFSDGVYKYIKVTKDGKLEMSKGIFELSSLVDPKEIPVFIKGEATLDRENDDLYIRPFGGIYAAGFVCKKQSSSLGPYIECEVKVAKD